MKLETIHELVRLTGATVSEETPKFFKATCGFYESNFVLVTRGKTWAERHYVSIPGGSRTTFAYKKIDILRNSQIYTINLPSMGHAFYESFRMTLNPEWTYSSKISAPVCSLHLQVKALKLGNVRSKQAPLQSWDLHLISLYYQLAIAIDKRDVKSINDFSLLIADRVQDEYPSAFRFEMKPSA